jgi:Protein of unknown function (DUF3489)
MRIYIIGNDGITLCREAPTTLNDGEIAVASNEELHAARLSGKRLLALRNALPGVEKRRRVGDRDALIDQLWLAIEALPDPDAQSDAKRPSKQDAVIAMLQRPEGATVDEVASATGWQRHTVWHCGISAACRVNANPMCRTATWQGPITDSATGRWITSHVMNQDFVTWVGQGRTADRSKEYLAPSDGGIVMIRRCFLDDLKAIAEGRDPKAVIRDPASNRAIMLPVAEREALIDGFTRAEMMNNPLARRGLQGYIFQTGQPAEIHAAFLTAMGFPEEEATADPRRFDPLAPSPRGYRPRHPQLAAGPRETTLRPEVPQRHRQLGVSCGLRCLTRVGNRVE